MEQIVNVGLIGYGLGGRVFHAPIITSIQGLNLHKIYVKNPENIKSVKARYENVQVTSSTKEVLEDENIQLVVIAAPNAAHYELALQALENGKNVVVEKPFTVTSEEADTLIALAKAKNKVLTVHQNRRWDSDFRTVEKVLKSGLLGDIVEFEAHYDRFRNYLQQNTWKETNAPGSGILYNLGSHLIDQAQALFGLPEEVFGDLTVQRKGGEVIDNFEVILKYPQLKVTLKAGMLVSQLGPHFTIIGTEGSFVKHGLDVQEGNLESGVSPNDCKDWGKEPENLWGQINTVVNGLHIIGKIESEVGDYRDFYRNVYKSILGEEALLVTPMQGRNTIRIIELVQKSNSEKRWVKFE